MTYSNVPRSLVYKEVDDISHFLGDEATRTMEREFYERLIKRPFIEESDNAPELVLQIFNNARYIYELIINLEESNPSICFRKYVKIAAHGVNDEVLKSHIVAATMALLYNWLNSNLSNNRLYIPGIKEIVYYHFDKKGEKDIIKLKQIIYSHFSAGEKEVIPEGIYTFMELCIENNAFPVIICNIDVPQPEDYVNNVNIPVQDIVEGVDYIIEGLELFGTNAERITYLLKILMRFENEKSLISDISLLERAKIKIEYEKDRLLSKSDEEEDTGLHIPLDNIYSFPDNSDENLESPLDENNSVSEEDTIIENIEKQEQEWDNRYDGFLKENLNAVAIYESLKDINSPHLPKTDRRYWWALYRVLVEIQWIRGKRGDKKKLLEWANHHFDLGWDWSKERLFKFGNVPENKVIRSRPINEWNERNVGNVTGDYYGELADSMIDTFQLFTNNGFNKDYLKYIKPRQQLINKGTKEFKRRKKK